VARIHGAQYGAATTRAQTTHTPRLLYKLPSSPVHDRRDYFASRMHINVVSRLMLHRSLHCVYTDIYSAWQVRTYCSDCLGSAAMAHLLSDLVAAPT